MNYREELLQAGFSLSAEQTEKNETTRHAWKTSKGVSMRAKATSSDGINWSSVCGGKTSAGTSSCEALYNVLYTRYGADFLLPEITQADIRTFETCQFDTCKPCIPSDMYNKCMRIAADKRAAKGRENA
jgi:hypothetical protein